MPLILVLILNMRDRQQVLRFSFYSALQFQSCQESCFLYTLELYSQSLQLHNKSSAYPPSALRTIRIRQFQQSYRFCSYCNLCLNEDDILHRFSSQISKKEEKKQSEKHICKRYDVKKS